MIRLSITISFFVSLISFFPVSGGAVKDAVTDLVEKPVEKAIDIRQETQQAEELWQQERKKLVAFYEEMQEEHDRLKAEEENLHQEKVGFQERIDAKIHQLEEIEKISQQIEPYLKIVAQQLRELFDDDTPFLAAERQKRIDNVERIPGDPGVDVSEKFRKVMEALMVEAEYGRTIEVYQETISLEGRPVLADIFRLGRMALFYQTLDQKGCGFYNVAEEGWTPLPKSYNYAVQAAIDIGTKRRPVELLTLPVGRLKVP